MGIDYSGFRFGKPEPRALRKHRQQATLKADIDAAYAAVDARDKRVCRATGAHLTPGAVDPKARLERHHLLKRSTHKSLRAAVSNIVTLSAFVHQLVEAHLIEIEGTDADQRLVFRWSESFREKGQVPPVRLLSKRRSQNGEAA